MNKAKLNRAIMKLNGFNKKLNTWVKQAKVSPNVVTPLAERAKTIIAAIDGVGK